MALDFPNTPTLNQVFTAPNGAMWMWDGVKWTAIASVSQYAANNNVGRNYIHNPLFNVAQRGAGPFTTGMFTLDRWQMAVVGAGGSMNVQQMQLVDVARAQIGDEQAAAYVYAQVTAGTNPTDYKLLQQKTEGVRRLAGKTVTVSFYAASSAGLPIGVNFQQDFGTGGSPSAMVVVPGQAITLTTGWARYSATFTIPSIAGKTLGTAGDDGTTLVFWFSAGTNYNTNSGSLGLRTQNVSLWGVQLEVGSVATPLEKPDPRYDLSNCSRFYQLYPGWIMSGYAAAGNTIYTSLPMGTPMRATPTVALAGTSYSNASAMASAGGGSVSITRLSMSITATGFGYGNADISLSADL